MTTILLAPLLIFMVFVAPLWLILHYRSKRKMVSGISDEERRSLDQLSNQAQAMQQRIESLEQILDESVPEWRSKHV